MASESVQILIEADNKASGALKKVAADAEDLGKRVKETGGKLKAGTELAGTFANAFGGGQIGQAAGQIAQLSERVSAFSELAKTSTAGAYALQGAMVGAAAIGGFQLGASIRALFDDTEKWNAELQKSIALSKELDAQRGAMQARGFAEARQDIGLIADPAEREAATRQRLSQIERQANDASSKVLKAQQQVADYEARAAKERRDILLERFGLNRVRQRFDVNLVANAKDTLETAKQQLKALTDEKTLLSSTISERTKHIEAIKAENAAKERSANFIESLRAENELLRARTDEERRALEAKRGTTGDGDQDKARRLLEQRDALKADQAREQQLKAEAQRLEAFQNAELQRLRERSILIREGAEAARKFNLESQGMDSVTASGFAAAEKNLSNIEALQSMLRDGSGELQATESRTLSRSGSNNVLQETLKQEFSKQLSQSIKLGEKLDKLITTIDSKGSLIVQEVG